MTVEAPSKDELLDEVDQARRALTAGKERYELAVIRAHEAGISNIKIAGRAGVTETAIRLMVKRTREK